MKINTITKPHCNPNGLFSLLIVAVILLMSTSISAAKSSTMDPRPGQDVFNTPELAAQALVKAISEQDKNALDKLLGVDYGQLLPMDNIDPVDRDNFLAAWSNTHKLIPEGERQQVLAVGVNDWILPIPVVKGDKGWFFDVDAGVERVSIRRIGRNELAAMQAVLAYYDAQMEYAEQDRDNNGRLEYAQKFISSADKHDGLYWEVAADEELSPLGPLFAESQQEKAYHGYDYRILTSQGKQAQGGAYSYLMNDRMVAGFALIAWPAEYGETGVMSFLVSHSGIIYEQDLGSDTTSLAADMQNFDPATGWKPVQEVHQSQVSAN